MNYSLYTQLNKTIKHVFIASIYEKTNHSPFSLLNKNIEGSGKRKLTTIDCLLILSFAAQTQNVNFPG